MKKEKIREVNDKIRANLPRTTPPHKIVLSEGVAALDNDELDTVLEKVKNFNSFDTADNDPWGEHDFGRIYHNDEKLYFKFDYYDKNLQFHGYDRHVLTIMFAEEY